MSARDAKVQFMLSSAHSCEQTDKVECGVPNPNGPSGASRVRCHAPSGLRSVVPNPGSPAEDAPVEAFADDDLLQLDDVVVTEVQQDVHLPQTADRDACQSRTNALRIQPTHVCAETVQATDLVGECKRAQI